MPFPESTSKLNDYDHPCMQSLSFPTLIPCGKIGEVTNRNRVSEVTLTESNEHQLKYCVYDDSKNEHVHPFAQILPFDPLCAKHFRET